MSAMCGVILAGGASTRMGQDKAQLQFAGIPLIAHAHNALLRAGIDDVVVVGHDRTILAEAGYHVVTDLWPGSGPLGGIVTAMKHRPDTSIVVLACDMPFITEAAIEALLVAGANEREGAIGHDGEQPQPLFVLLHPVVFPVVIEAFSGGERSPKRVWGQLDLTPASPVLDGRLADVDTPEEFRQAEEALVDRSPTSPAPGNDRNTRDETSRRYPRADS